MVTRRGFFAAVAAAVGIGTVAKPRKLFGRSMMLIGRGRWHPPMALPATPGQRLEIIASESVIRQLESLLR